MTDKTHLFVDEINISSKDTQKGRFYTTPEGNVYPSITTVLGSYEKPALNAWIQSIGAKAAEKEKQRAAARGTAIHDMLEKFLRNNPDPTEGHERIHIADYNAVKLLLTKVDNILALEIPLYSDMLKVAGRVDCIAEYNGTLSIIDFKTSTNAKDASIITDYFLQCTAYALMFHELYNIQIDHIRIIMSVEKGVPMTFVERVEDWIEPLCLKLQDYHKRHST